MEPEIQTTLSKIFMNTPIRTSSGKKKIIPNTAQNVYLNEISKTSKAKTSQQKLEKHISASNTNGKQLGGKSKIINQQTETPKKNTTNDENTEDIENSENLSDIEKSDSDSDSESKKDEQEKNDIDPNEEPEDEYEKEESIDNDNENEILATEEHEEEKEKEDKEDKEDKDKETPVEYNEDGSNEKDTEINEENENKGIEECLYQYDELVENNETEQPKEMTKEDRITDRQMTDYEKIRILGSRSKQILTGGKEMVVHENNLTSVELALLELKHKTTPLIIRRTLPDNTFEDWKVRELNVDDDDSNILIDKLHLSFDGLKNQYVII